MFKGKVELSKGSFRYVEWANNLKWYDKVFMAKVFDFTPDDLTA